jgi:hypothetical protein
MAVVEGVVEALGDPDGACHHRKVTHGIQVGTTALLERWLEGTRIENKKVRTLGLEIVSVTVSVTVLRREAESAGEKNETQVVLLFELVLSTGDAEG